MIGKNISHYRVLSELGRGGMGVVYKALDTKLGREVAIKVLPQHLGADAEATKRFLNEAKAASSLDHPHIGAIHEINETKEGLTYIVMAYYEGETLRARIDRGRISVEEALRLTAQIAKGLVKAHQKNIIHRDIKPSNVIITADGDAKLLDFGLAKLAGATKVTRTGSTLGTAAYMSPEQAKGEEVDARSDIWSLGVILYEMLAGRLPFSGEYEAAVLYAILNDDPPSVGAGREDVPVELENVVDRALAKKPAERYQTMQEFLEDIERQEERIKQGAGGRGRLAMRRKIRRRIVRIGVPAVLGAAAVAAVIIFNPLEIEIRPKTKEAIARENSIVVMPFANMMDPDDTDGQAGMISSLLTTGLGESEYLQVVNEGRVNDVLKMLGRENERMASMETALQVAQRTSSNWIVTGKIIQTEPNIVLSAEIMSAATERENRSLTVRGLVSENIFAVADRLKALIGRELALPLEAMAQLDRAVKEVTTENPEAYRYYLEANKEWYRLNDREAMANFAKAIELDSTFAIAYLRLAAFIWIDCWEYGRCDSPTVELCYRKANEHSEKLNALQRLELEAFGERLKGNHRREIELFEEVVKRDPQYKKGWEWLGHLIRLFKGDQEGALCCFDKVIELDSTSALNYGWISMGSAIIGDIAKADWAAEKYIALAPEDVQANFVRALVHTIKGEENLAIGYLEECERLKPGVETFTLGDAYFGAGRFEQADSVYRSVAMGPSGADRKTARSKLACIPMAQGRLDEALRVLDDGIAADRMERRNSWDIHVLKARIMMHKSQPREAFREMLVAKELGGNNAYLRAFHISFLAQTGDVEAAKDSLETHMRGLDLWSWESRALYSWPKGMVEFARGNPDSAFFHLERAVHDMNSARPWHGIVPRYYLAKAYFEAGRLREAERIAEEAIRLRHYAGVDHAILVAKCFYLSGLIHEAIGDRETAARRYREFIDMWHDADPDLPEVPDAKRRVATAA